MEQCEAYLCLLSPHIEEREKHYLGEKRHMREQQQLAFMIARYYGANALIVYSVEIGMSKSVQSYYQKSGRAGRDDLPAHCVVPYQKKDLCRMMCLLTSGGTFKSDFFKAAMDQAKKMQAHCELKVTLG